MMYGRTVFLEDIITAEEEFLDLVYQESNRIDLNNILNIYLSSEIKYKLDVQNMRYVGMIGVEIKSRLLMELGYSEFPRTEVKLSRMELENAKKTLAFITYVSIVKELSSKAIYEALGQYKIINMFKELSYNELRKEILRDGKDIRARVETYYRHYLTKVTTIKEAITECHVKTYPIFMESQIIHHLL